MNRMLKNILIICVCIIVLVIISMFIINLIVVKAWNKDEKIEDKPDCILVLGAAVWGDKPSPMLEDRLNTAIELYKQGVSHKIIVSGDHGQDNYDEVNTMKKYVIEHGVPSEDVFMDHAGFSTFESVYRAKEIFGVKSMVIVTQKYHLFRAVYISKNLGIKTYGVNSDTRSYVGAVEREVREVLARIKDFIKIRFNNNNVTYLGEKIDITGDGNITNDKK